MGNKKLFFSFLYLFIYSTEYNQLDISNEGIISSLEVNLVGGINSINYFTPNHLYKNCLLLHAPLGDREKFSNLVCYQISINFTHETSTNQKGDLNIGIGKDLIFRIEKIYTAYMVREGNTIKFPNRNIYNKLSIINVKNYNSPEEFFEKNNYKFLLYDFQNLKYFDQFGNTKKIVLTGKVSKKKDFRYLEEPERMHSEIKYRDGVKCFSAEEIKISFILGELLFTFFICTRDTKSYSVLEYDLKVQSNFSDGIKQFEDERFSSSEFTVNLFDYLKQIYDSDINNNPEVLIRLPTKKEKDILLKIMNRIFNFNKSSLNTCKVYDNDDFLVDKSYKFFSDEEYKDNEEKFEMEKKNKNNDDENGNNNNNSECKNIGFYCKVLAFLFILCFISCFLYWYFHRYKKIKL